MAAVMVSPHRTPELVSERDMKAAMAMASEPSSAIGTPIRRVSRARRIRSATGKETALTSAGIRMSSQGRTTPSPNAVKKSA